MCPLEKRRLVLGLSRADLGSKIKTTGEAVRLWERGDRTPSAEFYPVIAKALKVPVAEVIGWFHKETSTT